MIARSIARFLFNSIQGIRFAVFRHERRRTRILRGLYLGFLCVMGGYDILASAIHFTIPTLWGIGFFYLALAAFMIFIGGLQAQAWRRSDQARRARQAWSDETADMFRVLRDMFARGSSEWRQYDRLVKLLEN